MLHWCLIPHFADFDSEIRRIYPSLDGSLWHFSLLELEHTMKAYSEDLCSYAPQTQFVFQWDWKADWLEILLNPEDSKVVWRNWSGHASYSEIWAPEKIGWHWHQCKWSDMLLLIFWSCSRSVLFAVSQVLHSTFRRLLSWWTTKAARGHMPCEGSNVYHLESSQTARIHNEMGVSMICILDHHSGFEYEYDYRLQKWL